MPCISGFISELKHLSKSLKSLTSPVNVIRHCFGQHNYGKTQHVTVQLPRMILFTLKIHELLILMKRWSLGSYNTCINVSNRQNVLSSFMYVQSYKIPRK
jgi:hypothetical protein